MTLSAAYSKTPNWLVRWLPVLFFGTLTYLAGATNILSSEVHQFALHTIDIWWTQLQPMLGRVLVACLFISIVRLVHAPLQKRIHKALAAAGADTRDHEIIAWIARILYLSILVFGVAGILGYNIFGQVVTALFGASALLAFALKDTLNDFVSGITIRFNRNLNSGDCIEVIGQNHVVGTIKSFGYLQSELVGDDGKPIFVPNRIFWGAPLAKVVKTAASSAA